MTDMDRLIDDLADEAAPVQPYSTARGRTFLFAVAAGTMATVYWVYGFRGDVMALDASPILFVTTGLMVMLGVAAGVSVVRMARPQVGAATSPAPWLMAALLLVPLMVLVRLATGALALDGLAIEPGLRCLIFGIVAGLGTGSFLVAWLRQGAPVAPVRAAWLVGLAGGAVGALAVTLECPVDSVAHLGVWHVAAVPLSAVAARLLLPRFLRW